jgi:hypothetical protein
MQSTYTLWVRMPGDNRPTVAGWGKPVRLEITAPKGDNAADIARTLYDAMKRGGIEMLTTRP